MRTPFIISSSAHAAILFAAIVGIRADSFEVEEPPPIPVDILTVDEFTQLTSKAPAPEREVEEPAPEPEPKPVVEEEPEPEPEPEEVAALEPELLPPEPEPEPAPEPEPVSEAEPLPLPEPEPLPSEPVAEPVPEPVAAPEREVEEVAEPEPEPEPELVEVVAPPRKKPTPPPSVRTALAQPKPEEPKKEEKKFDVDRISALLNKLPDEAKPRPAPPVQGEGSPNQERNLGGVDQTLTLSEVAFLRRQVERCWRLPAGIANAADMVVKVQLNLNPDGSLAGTPVVLNTGGPGFDVAASGAIRAVIQCQPYTLPADKYDAWRDLTFNFDPSQMLGG